MKEKKNKRTLKIIIGIAAVIAAAVILKFVIPQNYTGTEATVIRGNIATYYSFSGSIESTNRQVIYANSIQQIKSLKVAVGDTVEEGDTLYTTTLGADVDAPISGEILSIAVSENQQVLAGAIVMEIIDYSSLELNVKVDEYDLSAISKGMDATVAIHALSKDVTGTVTDVSSVGTYANGVTYFTATISIPQDVSVKVGMSAEAKILKSSVTDVLTLPASAIQYDSGDNPFVYIKQNNKLTTQGITLGITDGTTVEIVSGLNENDKVFIPDTQVDYSNMRNSNTTDSGSGE